MSSAAHRRRPRARRAVRSLLMPGVRVRDSHARLRRLPRFFYVVDSWNVALETRLTPHFAIWEFMDVDLFEPAPLRRFPRYVPCAVTVARRASRGAARASWRRLFTLRRTADIDRRRTANRSPGSPHCWGTAANIYRIGDRVSRRARGDRASMRRWPIEHPAGAARAPLRTRARAASTITCISISDT